MTAFSEWSASYNHPLIHRVFFGVEHFDMKNVEKVGIVEML